MTNLSEQLASNTLGLKIRMHGHGCQVYSTSVMELDDTYKEV